MFRSKHLCQTICLLLCAVFLLTAFAGCGGNQKQSSDDQNPSGDTPGGDTPGEDEGGLNRGDDDEGKNFGELIPIG